MTSLDDIYTREWVAHDFAELQPEFDVVADAIYRQFNLDHSSSVVDVGCGPGMVLGRLAMRGVDINGVEGSRHCIAYATSEVRANIQHADILHVGTLGGYNLVICTEVAEHLDAKDAPALVSLLCSAMCPIVFTAAGPNQDGHHHVNCQEQEYWITMFHERGALFDLDATSDLETRWLGLKRLSHMRKNVMVFR